MNQAPDRPAFLDLAPIASVAGTVTLPGSKSISNRALLLAALSSGTTSVRGLLASDDTDRMLEALRLLGVRVERQGHDFAVFGVDGRFANRQAKLFLGNAGTAVRPLTAVLALLGGHYELSGVPRMHERPIGDLVDALRMAGADIRYLDKEGYPPLAIYPATINGAPRVAVRGNVSSQFLSALLMALPLNGRDAVIEVAGELISKPYIEMTCRLMARFGVAIERDGWNTFRIAGGQRYISPQTIYIEGDASNASYFLAAGAIGGGPVRVEGVGRGSIQGDIRFTEVLRAMGARVSIDDNAIEVRGSRPLRPVNLDCNHIPDAAMTAAIMTLFASGPSMLSNIGSWRVKETDRIHAMATELRKVGATVEAGTDFIRITPPARFIPATIDTYDDHRMAMCFSLVALGGVAIRINDPACVGKTFPSYFEVLNTLIATGGHGG
ncbi:MAG: 3-phosphoshikimate 1-carboxyvinyltransferase [Betaproteobacteria bacterium]|nr:3-phosphoshikimate 1-carboxyvinyltransferase [Betaproteobacteria bacterium]